MNRTSTLTPVLLTSTYPLIDIPDIHSEVNIASWCFCANQTTIPNSIARATNATKAVVGSNKSLPMVRTPAIAANTKSLAPQNRIPLRNCNIPTTQVHVERSSNVAKRATGGSGEVIHEHLL